MFGRIVTSCALALSLAGTALAQPLSGSPLDQARQMVAADNGQDLDFATRGVHHRDVSTITTQFRGVFKTDPTLRQRFLDFVNRK